MRAAFAPGGDAGLNSDPALEPSEVGGQTLLQRRLSLYGKVLVAQSIVYWLIYAIIWGPTVGFAKSLGHIVSWDVVVLTGIYSLYWFVARGRPRSAQILLATDVIGALAIGIDNVYLMLGDLGTISGVFENLIGFICILLLRSLIVPSTVKRTILCGVLMCGPTILGVVFGRHRRARRAEGSRLRARQEHRGIAHGGHGSERGARHAALPVSRSGEGGRARRHEERHLLPRRRRLLHAHRTAGIHR